MKKELLSIALALCLALTLLPSPVAAESALIDQASPYAYPEVYTGNPVKDAGDTIIDVSKTKFGALPGNNAMASMSVLYKGSHYVVDGHRIFRLPLNATDGTKYTLLYNADAIDYGLSNLQIAGDYMFWEERLWSGADVVRIRRMKIDGTGLTTFANGEDKYTLYNGKVYVRIPGDPVKIASYNLNGSGRKVILTPPSGKTIALVPPGVATKRLLEFSGGYCPFGFSGDKLYYVLNAGVSDAPELWRMNLDGSSNERVITLPYKGRVGFRMVHQNYLYYTGFDGTYRIPFSGGEAQRVLPDTESINLFGNKMFLSRITYSQYLSNPPKSVNAEIYYPVTAFYVADLDGKNMRYLFSTSLYPSMLNIASPDYVYAEDHASRGIYFSINPSIKTDIRIDTSIYDKKTDTVTDHRKVSVLAAKFVEKGNAVDGGWYYLRCMYNYLSINAQGQAEFNNTEPYQKFKFTYQGGGNYRIETESGKVLSVTSSDKIGNGNRLIAQNTTPFDWILRSERDGLFSLRPYVKDDVMMNASGAKKTNGTHIIVWNSIEAPENARWRLIPAGPVQTNQTTTHLDVADSKRLSGSDRFETAIAISKDSWPQAENVILANGNNFPSALAGSSLAYLKDAPVLLTNTKKLNPTTAGEIKRLGAKTVYILGNQDEVSLEVENELKAQYQVVRLAGTDLFNTAVKIGEEVRKTKSFDTVALATQNNFPDTLAITPFSAKNTMPILFSEKDKLRSDSKAALTSWGVKNVIISGGVNVISAAVENELKSMGITVTRLAGEDRYDTALTIVKHFEKSKYTQIALATGLNYPDALTGAALAAKKDVPLLLVGGDSVKKSVMDYIDTHEFTQAFVFGGEGVIKKLLEVK